MNLQKWLAGLLGVILFAALWSAVTALGLISPDMLPPLAQIISYSGGLLVSAEFWSTALGPSLERLFYAALFAVPLATVLGMITGISNFSNSLVRPLFNFTYPLPKVAIFPLMLAVFGIGDRSKIVLIAIGIFYPLFLNVMEGAVRLNSSRLQDVMAVYQIKGWRRYYHFYFLGLWQDFITGMKAALGYGFTLVIVGEMTASQNGIGNFIWRAWDGYRVTEIYAGIFILCLAGFIAQASLDLLRRSSRPF